MESETKIVKNPKGKADIWEHFGLKMDVSSCEIITGVAQCIHCHTTVKAGGGGTTNLRTHLMRHHPSLCIKLKAKHIIKPSKYVTGNLVENCQLTGRYSISDQDSDGLIKTEKKAVDETVNRLFSSSPTSAPQMMDDSLQIINTGNTFLNNIRKIGRKPSRISFPLLDFFVLDLQPLEMLQSKAFIDFVAFLNPSYTLEDRKDVRDKIDELYNQEHNKLKKLLDGTEGGGGAITLEIWKDDNSSNISTEYLSVEVHFVTKSWKLVKSLLNTVPLTDTAPTTISETLQNVLSGWDLSNLKIIGVVPSDTNLITALKHLHVSYVSCLGNIINHAATQAINSREVLNTIDKVKAFCRLFIGSSTLSQLLREVCEQCVIDFDEHDFVAPAFTPWYETYRILVIVYKINLPILKLFEKEEITNIENLPSLTEKDFEMIKDVIEVLSSLIQIKESLCYEDNPTASSVLPILYQLTNVFKIAGDTSTSVRTMKNNIKTLLQSMDISHNEDMREELFLATTLDPRFKSLWFLSYSEQIEVYKRLIDVALQVSNSATDEESDSPAIKKIKVEKTESGDSSINSGSKGLASIFGQADTSLNSTPMSEFSGAEVEVELYKAEEQIPMNSDPYEWWQIREVKYPLLSQLARRYLCLPACALQPNFLFTSAGSEYNAKRQILLLSNENVEKRLFLHKALKE